MNSSRATLLVIFSLLLATFTVATNFVEGDQFLVAVHHDGNTEFDTVSISGGTAAYSTTGVIVTLSDNSVAFSTGVVDDKDYLVQVTKLGGSNTVFSAVTVVGYDFEAVEENTKAVLVNPLSVLLTFDSVSCLVSCEALALLEFQEAPVVNITSISPKVIPTVGGSITIYGEGFNYTTPSVTISKDSKTTDCEVTEATSTYIVCTAASGVSKGYTVTVYVGLSVVNIAATYGEPFITGTRTTYAEWAAFVYITGGNFNPNDVHVELSQGAARKRAVVSHPVCQIVNVTPTQITCSVIGLNSGTISAVVTVGGHKSGGGVPKAVGNVVHPTAFTPIGNAVCIPPSGVADIYHTDMCNCWSGYAPSDSTGTDCNVKAKCAQKVLGDLDYFGSDIPERPITTFKDDTLVITQSVGIVLNRRSSFINFRVPKLNHTLPAVPAGTQGALTCNYPGILWEKSINSLDCKEVFTAHMPWSQNGFCGFVQDLDATTATHAIYKSVLSTSYIEVFAIDGVLSQRLSLYSYQIHVSFLTQKAISSSNLFAYIADPSVNGFIQVSITSDAVYDAASGHVLVSFITTAAWPYQLNSVNPGFVGSVPVHTGLTADIANVEYYTGQCDTTQDSACQQKWYVRLATAGICDIGGVYTFEDSLLCRDVNSTEEAGSCIDNPANVQFSVRIKKTDLCDPTALDATEQMTTDLSSFFDQTITTPTDTFQTGDMIFWRFSLKNPQGTIDRIVFNQIEIDLIGGGADVLLETTNITTVGSSAELRITNMETLVPAGSTANLFFSHKLLRSALPNTVGTLAGTSVDNVVSLSVTVVVDIWYHGNQEKRTIHMTGASSQAASSHDVRVIDNGADSGEFSAKLGGLNLFGSSESAASTFGVSMSLSLLLLTLAYLML